LRALDQILNSKNTVNGLDLATRQGEYVYTVQMV